MTAIHNPHSWIKERKRQGPHLTRHEHLGLNGNVALLITKVVGTIWCAYVFAGIAFVALPQAIQAGSLIVLVNWLSSNFLQLVLLPIIIVGQNILAKASDKQAAQTFKDAEAILQLQDEVHRLIEINNQLTQEIHSTIVKKES
jgi:cytochrome c biogenesis factor